MELGVTSLGTGKTEKVSVSEKNFNQEFNEGLVHQVVTAYLAAARAGTAAQKNRSDVRGGGKKPWRQKGTGRARAGTIRSPLWRSGGVTFAARPRSYEQKVNKKMYKAAIRSIFSELHRQERLIIIDQFNVEQPKTKELINQLQTFKFNKNAKILLVTDAIDVNLELAARNLYQVSVCTTQEVNPVILVGHDHIVMTAAALQQVEENLS